MTILDPSGRTQAASTVVRLKITAPGVPKPDSKGEHDQPDASCDKPGALLSNLRQAMMCGAAISSGTFHTRNETGFVLVAVLWILAALATLASIYSAYAIQTAGASHILDDRVQAEESVRAGVRNDGSPATLRSRENAPVSRRVHIADRSHRRRCPLSL